MQIASFADVGPAYVYSATMRQRLSALTDTAVVVFGRSAGGVMVGTWPCDRPGPSKWTPREPLSGTAPCTDPSRIEIDVAAASDREGSMLAVWRASDDRSRRWYVADCRYGCGTRDRLGLLLPETDPGTLRFALRSIWPVLRQDCLDELAGREIDEARRALSWFAEQQADTATMVLDARARLLHRNAAARRLIDARSVLTVDRVGRLCPLHHDAADLARAARGLVEPEAPGRPGAQETVMLLSMGASGDKLPLTLSACTDDGLGRGYVVASAPVPPSAGQVEAMARRKGLTRSEARVAALLQQGMSNKGAADAAGVSQQTIETYAKRILSKLGVSRSQLIASLTWQARGYRPE